MGLANTSTFDISMNGVGLVATSMIMDGLGLATAIVMNAIALGTTSTPNLILNGVGLATTSAY